MVFTISSIRARLIAFAGENNDYARYADSPMLKHFKAGANAAWRDDYNLERDEARYTSKHGSAAGDAFSDGFTYSAAFC